MERDFRFADEALPGVRWDAKYATWDNFTGTPVDGYGVNRIVASAALCTGLARARAAAASHGLELLLWDGYRPQRAVDRFVRWAAEREDGRTKARHYPNIRRADMLAQGYVARRSGHSRGSAIDLTLFDLATGELLPMAGGHDLMDPVSHHGAVGISAAETANRERLRALMTGSGFLAYEAEWWHYTLRVEPYPDTYFDFAIA